MIYSKENLDKLSEECAVVREKCQRVISSYVLGDFKNSRAREFATHGLPRRVGLLAHCIESVFANLPPDATEPPPNDVILDTTVCLQSFVFNVFGCVDNLAHIWVREKELTGKNGKPLKDTEIGLIGTKYKPVLDTLSKDFVDYLKRQEPWFEQVRNFRHALAHRIPLYIPPYYVPDEKLQEYEEIGRRIDEAVQQRNYGEVDQLQDQQNLLTLFCPVATHSFSEKSKLMYFHARMIEDFNLVEEIAQKLLQELGMSDGT